MLQLGGIAIDAVSVGGLETCIALPGHKLCFDIGRCPRSAVALPRVLFTHAHVDHMGGAVFHCATRSMMGMKPPDYWMPAENVEAFGDMLAAWRRLDRSELTCTVHAAVPGEAIALGKGLEAVPFRAIHRVPTVGYALFRTTRRLKAEFQGLPGPSIRDLRLGGTEVTEAHRTCELAFTGDTLVDVAEREAVVRQARVLVMEVTFFDDRVSVAACRDKGHVHLDEIIARPELFEANEHLLFTHQSARYGSREAAEICRRRLPPELARRVTLLGLPHSEAISLAPGSPDHG